MSFFAVASLLGIGFLITAFLLSFLCTIILTVLSADKPYDPNADYSDSEGE